MSRLPRWGYREKTSFLRSRGYEFYREGKGDHELWWHPQKRVYTLLDHARVYPIGTLKKILGDLHIDERELRFQDRPQHTTKDLGPDLDR